MKSLLFSAAQMAETLAAAPVQGKKSLEPLRTFSKETGFPLNIVENHEVTDNLAEVHMHEADLWGCIEGEATFICGGEMVDPWCKENKDGTKDEREIKAKEIKGGTEIVLKKGDWLWIPAGEPHQHQATGTARMLIIKVPVPAE